MSCIVFVFISCAMGHNYYEFLTFLSMEIGTLHSVLIRSFPIVAAFGLKWEHSIFLLCSYAV